MPLTRTDYTPSVSPSNFGVGGYTTPAIVAPDNSLIVMRAGCIPVASDPNAHSANLTITDSLGLTWTSRVNVDGPSYTYGQRVWTAPVTTGGSMTVMLDTVSDSPIYVYIVEPFAYTGYDTTTPVGATGTTTDVDGDGAASITLSGTSASTSEVLGFLLTQMNSGTLTVSPGTSFSEIHDTIGHSDWLQIHSQAQVAAISTVGWNDIEATGDAIDACMCAIEIRAAGGGAAPGGSAQRRLQGFRRSGWHSGRSNGRW